MKCCSAAESPSAGPEASGSLEAPKPDSPSADPSLPSTRAPSPAAEAPEGPPGSGEMGDEGPESSVEAPEPAGTILFKGPFIFRADQSVCRVEFKQLTQGQSLPAHTVPPPVMDCLVLSWLWVSCCGPQAWSSARSSTIPPPSVHLSIHAFIHFPSVWMLPPSPILLPLLGSVAFAPPLLLSHFQQQTARNFHAVLSGPFLL